MNFEGVRGWLALFVFVLILLVIFFVALNILALLIPAVLVILFLFWLLGLISRKRRRPVVKVWFKKF